MTNFNADAFGKSLLRAVPLSLVGLLTCIAPSAAADCRLKETASVPISFDVGGRILLDVKINDTLAKMALDTGAGFSVLDNGFVKRQGLPQLDAQRFGYGLTGRAVDSATQIARLSLGTAVSHGETFAVGTVDRDGTDTPPAGTFANDYLANFDVEIDPAAGRVNLFSPDHCRGNVVYWAKEYFRLPARLTDRRQLQVDIEVNGTPLRAVIDTGIAATTMRLATGRDRFGITPDSAAGEAHGTIIGVEGSKLETFEHPFDSLTFDGITLRNTQMMIADIDVGRNGERVGQNFAGVEPSLNLQRRSMSNIVNSDNPNAASHITGDPEQPDVLIGMALLRKLHLFIDYHEPALYYTLAEQKAAG